MIRKIICALTCLCASASTYMKSYYDKVQTGLSVGSWGDFAQELKNIYGQQDDKEGAKKELMALWVNKDLARKLSSMQNDTGHWQELSTIVMKFTLTK